MTLWSHALSGLPAARSPGGQFSPLNPTKGATKWQPSTIEDEREFVRRLEAKGISTTVRDTRGREIDGACGQLAAKE